MTIPKNKSGMAEVYVLFREGTYRHQCGGIFTSKILAKQALEFLESEEPDDYYDWEVRVFKLDTITETFKSGDSWHEYRIIEPEPITQIIKEMASNGNTKN